MSSTIRTASKHDRAATGIRRKEGTGYRFVTSAILFDLDDTLMIDAAALDAALLATGAEAHDRYGADPTALAQTVRQCARRIRQTGPVFPYCDAIGITYGEGLWGHFAGQDPNLATLREWVPAYQRATWSSALRDHSVADVVLAERLAALFLQQRRTRHALFPDVETLLRALRGSYRLALVTNGAPDMQREKVQAVGLDADVDVITISGEVGVGKPGAQIFTLTLRQLDVPAAAAVMVGNDLGRDIVGAHNAGLRGIWINRTGATLRAGDVVPDATITTLSDLPALCAGTMA